MANHASVRIPYSRVKFEVAKILVNRGYVASAEQAEGRFPELEIVLKYKDGKPVIQHLDRVSKPGCRVYASKRTLPHVLNGLGMAIISTSQGVMDDKEARQKNVGGEVLCEVY